MKPIPVPLHSLRPLALVLSIGAACTAWAQPAPPAPPASSAPAAPEPAAPASAPTLGEIQVKARSNAETATGPVNGYRAKRSITATKTDTSLAETPQSITVVTRDQMVDQGVTNTQDALGYAAGVRSDAYGNDSRTDSVRIRGADPSEYLDGLRKTTGYYTSNGRTDPYTLERIEVLRGPAAMLFGQGSTAGVINFVSKRPLEEVQREIGVDYGSFNRRELKTDLTGPLSADGEWLYRVIAVARKADTQVDFVPDDRRLLAPSLTWKPNGRTSLTLRGLVQDDRSGSTSQFLPWIGTLLPSPAGQLPINAFIGQPDDRYDTDRRTLGYSFEHRIDDDWAVRQNVQWARNDVFYASAYGDSFTSPGDWAADPVGKRLIGRFHFVERTRFASLATDQHVEGHVRTGDVAHQVLAGLDVARFRVRSAGGTGFPDYYPGGTVPSIDAYAPVYPVIAPPASTDSPVNTLRQTGVYLQDQMKWGPWIAVAGLRHDRVLNRTEGSDDERSRATTKRLGLMHVFANGWSPYLSYSESFSPEPNQLGVTLKPLRGKQREAGVKYEPAGSAVAFNASFFELEEKNRTSNPTPTTVVQLGRTVNRGLELEARGSLTPAVDVVAHFNHIDIDEQLEGLPQNQAALWAKWRFALAGQPGFSVGAGVRHMSSFRDTSSGVGPELPRVTLVDALVAYDTPDWRFALNVANLGDKRYFATCLSRGDCWYGTRRNAIASLTYKF